MRKEAKFNTSVFDGLWSFTYLLRPECRTSGYILSSRMVSSALQLFFMKHSRFALPSLLGSRVVYHDNCIYSIFAWTTEKEGVGNKRGRGRKKKEWETSEARIGKENRKGEKGEGFSSGIKNKQR